MPLPPDITFRQSTTPFNTLTSLFFAQSKLGSNFLPVEHGEVSNAVLFRIYNNFALNSGIGNALNVNITTYDGSSAMSHTANTPPVSQSWLHVLENGFGENSSNTPDLYTHYEGVDTPVGGNNVYYPQKGSNASYGIPNIRAGTNSNGSGYIEVKGYCSVPDNVVGDTYYFSISVLYEFTT